MIFTHDLFVHFKTLFKKRQGIFVIACLHVASKKEFMKEGGFTFQEE
jgi:hypothetical protein